MAPPGGDARELPVDRNEMKSYGQSERAISMFRTATSSVTRSTKALPDEVGAMMWWATYAPHASAYVPLYVAAPTVPLAYTVGSLHHYDPAAAWWAFAAVGNYAARWYKFAMPLVAAAQREVGGGEGSTCRCAPKLVERVGIQTAGRHCAAQWH